MSGQVEPRPVPQTCQNAACRAVSIKVHCKNPGCGWRVCEVCNTISAFVKSKNAHGWAPVTSSGNPVAGTGA